MEHTLIHNEAERYYAFEVEGKTARIEYIRAQHKIFLTHTEVPKGLEGKGVGSALVKAVLEEVKANDWTLIPLCPFVAAYIKRHPEWRELVLKGINIA